MPNPAAAAEQLRHGRGWEGGSGRIHGGEDRAPERALGDRHPAAAEATLHQSTLPEVADLSRREDTVDLAEDGGEHGAPAPPRPGDVQNRRHRLAPLSSG
jgi:hypothetical protein